ncbi:MAG: acyl-CoA dehydrogenase [Mycolicibacterium cosmeticum]|nr:acyl-CoA dehydrogenase [Mycolicibacterium cosmeticum]
MSDELQQLVADIGRRSYDENFGKRRLPEVFDAALWQTLEETGLSRLTTQQDAGPAEAAVVLAGLARFAAAVPIAETDLLAGWLAARAGIDVPESGPLTVAIGTGGSAPEVPWARDATVLVADRSADVISVGLLTDPQSTDDHNLGGEPRGAISYDTAGLTRLDVQIGDELVRRGAWARCVQIIGAFDSALELTVAHTSERVQFGRALSKFQAVQHSLAAMAGEIERARAATDLATAAVTEYGFAATQADYAVTVAKVAVGRAVTPVTTIAHQLHGAIGVTIEHQLWSATMRARSWSDEFGSTASYARRLGRLALTADDPWDVLISCP